MPENITPQIDPEAPIRITPEAYRKWKSDPYSFEYSGICCCPVCEGSKDERLKPLESDLNNAYSWHLENPVVFGWREDRGMWMAWDRHSGEVHHAIDAPRSNRQSRWLIEKLSTPKGYMKDFNNFIYDAIA